MRWLVLLLFLTAVPSDALAQDDGHPAPLMAVRLGDGDRVRVDGQLDEAVWARAPIASGFRQSEPEPGAPASERTEVAVAYDGAALYVGVRAYVRDPSTLVRRLVRRDGFSDASDRVFIEVGSPADGRTAFSFGVNLAGAQQDVLLSENRASGDVTWDAVWDSAVGRFSGPGGAGYAVEVRVPFSQLRYDAGSDVPWAFNVQRDVAATGEITYWSPVLPDRDGYVSQFGSLVGLRGLRAPRRVEVVPYAATRLTRAPGDAADPFYAANDVAPRLGLDARVGLTAGLSLAATVNPDFGHVEADPAVVNLSQFEVQFDERRPFFSEGTDVFAFGATRGRPAADRPQFFYSRRIGGPATSVTNGRPLRFNALHGGGAAAWHDVPGGEAGESSIAGAAKVSGQAGAWTLGLLEAVTTGEDARVLTPDGVRTTLPMAPAANYLVGRAQRRWRGGRTVAGGYLSSVVRDGQEAVFRPYLASSATVGGVDVEAATEGRAWTVSGVVVGSHVRGDEAAVAALQAAPQRYYQRPDAGYLALDPAARSLSGYRAEAAIAKTGGGPNWRGSLTLGATSPGFEVNDLGFQERADLLSADWEVRYNVPSPRASALRYLTTFAYGTQALNYGGDRVARSYNVGTYAFFSNRWGAQIIGTVRPTYLNDRLTRGGPVAERPADASVSTYLGTNAARRLSASVSVAARRELPHAYENAGTEWTTTVRPRVRWRPTDALSLAFEPDWVRAQNTDLYRGRVAAEGGAGDVGGRYLFLDYRYESLDLGLRVDWAFTPDLALQLVATPQVDALEFGTVRALARAGSYDFVAYDGLVEPYGDYTRLSLRGNAVLRWEWRPGSTVYAVWQQVRDEYGEFRGLGVADDIGDVFGGDLTNVFLLKASYWFGL